MNKKIFPLTLIDNVGGGIKIILILLNLKGVFIMSMTSVNMKYLKDENGNTISPVTSASSVYTEEGISVEREFLAHSVYNMFSNTSVDVNNSLSFASLTTGGIKYVAFECRIGAASEEYTYFTTGKYYVRLGKKIEISQSCAFGTSGVYMYMANYTLTDTQLTYNRGHLVYMTAVGSENKILNLDLNSSNIAIINMFGYKY